MILKEMRGSKVAEYGLIMIGCILLAFGIKCIYDPNEMVTGGVSGLSIVIRSMTEGFFEGGIPLWLSNLMLNVPLFIVAFFVKGWNYIRKTLFATLFLTVALAVMPNFVVVSDDFLLAAVFGGLFCGIGIALVFLARATTGGTDMLADLLHKKLRSYSIAQIMQVIDAVIVIIGMFTFGVQRALYAVIAIYLSSKVIDMVLDGLKFSKLAYIISDHSDAIGQKIMTEMDRGATELFCRGVYSKVERNMLFCVVSKKEIVALKELVYACDPKAFVIVSDVREVLGEGFIPYK